MVHCMLARLWGWRLGIWIDVFFVLMGTYCRIFIELFIFWRLMGVWILWEFCFFGWETVIVGMFINWVRFGYAAFLLVFGCFFWEWKGESWGLYLNFLTWTDYPLVSIETFKESIQYLAWFSRRSCFNLGFLLVFIW